MDVRLEAAGLRKIDNDPKEGKLCRA